MFVTQTSNFEGDEKHLSDPQRAKLTGRTSLR
jgi:hypothetical protein